MANETSATITLTSTVSGVTTKATSRGSVSRSNPQAAQGSFTASSTSTQIQIIGTVTEDIIMVKNDGDTNVVHIQTGSSGTTGRFSTIPAGGLTYIHAASGVSYYAICETGQTTTVTFSALSN